MGTDCIVTEHSHKLHLCPELVLQLAADGLDTATAAVVLAAHAAILVRTARAGCATCARGTECAA